MNIEHVTDRNSTSTTGAIGVTDMIDLQQARVADHIADLEREGTAIRAERELDHLREHAATGTDAADHPAHVASRRVRLGRWFVAMGEAIAGPAGSSATGRSMATASTKRNDRGDDGNDRLATAA
jgi:hypothetical protein